ncbi:chromatin assembly factor 1 subunit A-domain-containing protein [Desarmillaria tabescens]|uniref:Chromatin assembly factor 1 subunit A-domain-containing protein n=1 Tax=Armillaria tabescens TaxID=1929756 RepID=A0AA39KGL0_ARMTA|nr:chromatin assembly factor 1 subunit A-domain-containing protein [Desarmillaria tabescens]KAK0459570.1 chromatin assembly factor 1 subunit A-domain-containing protein [Desarmillaria tabescens]
MATPTIITVNPEAQKTEKPLTVEIRNNKVVFKQKIVSLEKQSETLQEIVKFRELLEYRMSSGGSPLVTIPNEYQPVVAKLAFESDKSLQVIARHIKQELLPVQDDEDRDVSACLPVAAVEAVIKSTMNRNNYGLDALPGVKLPSSSCVWRWEMKEQYKDWLPKAVREKTEARIAERVEAKKVLKTLFEALPQQERDSMLGCKGAATAISPARDALQAFPTNTSQEDAVHLCSQPEQDRELSKEPPDNQSGGSSSKRPKKAADPVRAAKEKEKSEKKAAKAEKEKKEKESQNKSRSLMATFFSKPKASAPAPTSSKPETQVASSSTTTSDFDRMFKPFVLKKDAELAPWNQFLQKRCPRGSQDDVIVIDDDDEMSITTTCQKPSEVQVEKLTPQERLQDILSSIAGLAPSPTRRRTSTPFKAYSSVSVRDMVTQLSEAEVTGDTGLVRELLSKLCDRATVPAKVFIFADDARPGYFGTWTRSSKTIGPRTPLHRDTLEFDYAYDSGEEWEEEPLGEADDVVDDEDDEGEVEDPDSDMGDWLVDDDDEEPGTPLEDREMSFLPDISRAPKRKPEATENKPPKKRKIVVPLVPYAKGPYWEDVIGECPYDAFKPYRIRLFNDTPFPINPFTFCSMPQQIPSAFAAASRHDDHGFTVPSIPVRPGKAQESSNVAVQPWVVVPKDSVPKKVAPLPKTVFPEAHLPLLLSKINALQTTNLTFLVEAIYQDLRAHKVKKNAIEAKVREVGEKNKDTKFWKVKPDFEQENTATQA